MSGRDSQDSKGISSAFNLSYTLRHALYCRNLITYTFSRLAFIYERLCCEPCCRTIGAIFRPGHRVTRTSFLDRISMLLYMHVYMCLLYIDAYMLYTRHIIYSRAIPGTFQFNLWFKFNLSLN